MTIGEAELIRDTAIDKHFDLDTARLLAEILVVLVEIRDKIKTLE
jgi:hypothetical protein